MKVRVFTLLTILFIIIPLGLLTDNPAWGEWDFEFYEQTIGFIPEGMKNFPNFKSLIPDYSVDGLNQIISYYISAFIGVGLIYSIFYILKWR